ncbi:putative membrane-anchored protein [Edaphobacter lichenicola]|uniref:Membrane-anchored protein n=1 Tax=Tunturiibacter gelidiferens TaxID=3069689 RepID=A0ACC5NZZ9_9BACT|nr:putative membrane-anchored protein [Edaphobacter lichenicola]
MDRRISIFTKVVVRVGLTTFFLWVVLWFLLGFLRKTAAKTWCFDGEVVVFCVVNVVIKQSSFVVMGNVTRILSLFFGFPVLGTRTGWVCGIEVGCKLGVS